MSEKSFWRMTLDTNPDHCNLNCIMCEDHSPYSEDRQSRRAAGRLRPIMAPDLMERCIREAAALGIRELIPSTMGEPLLYPHFDRIIELCRELGLSVNLTTNGTFPAPSRTQNVEYWAEKILPVASDVKISWNGASHAVQERIMPGSALDRQINHARRFIDCRNQMPGTDCTVTMQLTFMRSNLPEIEDLVVLALELGFDRIKGHQLWAHFDEIRDEDLRSAPELIDAWNQVVDRVMALVERHNRTATRPFRLDNFQPILPAAPRAARGACPFLGREVWINSVGRFDVCCAPDQQRRSLGEFGDLDSASLSELVASDPYTRLVENYREHPLCASCNMRRPDAER